MVQSHERTNSQTVATETRAVEESISAACNHLCHAHRHIFPLRTQVQLGPQYCSGTGRVLVSALWLWYGLAAA
jgi:hypothetical protein